MKKERAPEFYRPLELWQTSTVTLGSRGRKEDRQRALRLYCTQITEMWMLQIRTPMSVQGRAEGKKAIAACADLTVADMVALRDAINAFLAERDYLLSLVDEEKAP
jgi:hypothetical protein